MNVWIIKSSVIESSVFTAGHSLACMRQVFISSVGSCVCCVFVAAIVLDVFPLRSLRKETQTLEMQTNTKLHSLSSGSEQLHHIWLSFFCGGQQLTETHMLFISSRLLQFSTACLMMSDPVYFILLLHQVLETNHQSAPLILQQSPDVRVFNVCEWRENSETLSWSEAASQKDVHWCNTHFNCDQWLIKNYWLMTSYSNSWLWHTSWV